MGTAGARGCYFERVVKKSLTEERCYSRDLDEITSQLQVLCDVEEALKRTNCFRGHACNGYVMDTTNVHLRYQ